MVSLEPTAEGDELQTCDVCTNPLAHIAMWNCYKHEDISLRIGEAAIVSESRWRRNSLLLFYSPIRRSAS